MSSLKEIKTRIASVKNTLKITSAMKMVASAKLHKAQIAIGNKLPYEQKLHHILSGLLQDDDLQRAMHDELGFGNPHGHSPVVLQDIGLDQVEDFQTTFFQKMRAFHTEDVLEPLSKGKTDQEIFNIIEKEAASIVNGLTS